MGDLSFWLGGLTAVTAAIMTVTRRNAVASVMWLVVAFFGMAVLFFGMDAGFIGVIQILVYAGAIMALFLFVIMLLNLTPAGLLRIDRPKLKIAGLAASLGVVALVIAMAAHSAAWHLPPAAVPPGVHVGAGGAQTDLTALRLSDQLFAKHLLPFEAASVLLLVAIVGSVALTKKKV